MAGEDKRVSPSKSIAYGNPTVVQTMEAWGGFGAKAAYVHGDITQVLPTMVTILDVRHAFGALAYSIEVPIHFISSMPTGTPEKILETWYGIGSDNVSDIRADDVLVILDVVEGSRQIQRAVALMSLARRANAKVVIVAEPGKRLPSNFFGGETFTGSENDYMNIFGYLALENAVANIKPNRIILLGANRRLFTSAIGAMDFLARFDTSGASLRQLAGRVVVDGESDMGMIDGSSTLKLLESFQIPTTEYPLTPDLSLSTDKVLIKPV
jgi:hypothetical protein